ncbi:MAG: gfo/Idh/MocA family oxidoreductase [Candidatus Electrothrix sp. AX5]|nr:gfo/Idh/MocA family oxidoreductase [Candidatus Electrothrix sp. AX5]
MQEPLKIGFIGGAIDSAVGLIHKISSEMDNRWALSAGCFSRHEQSNHRTASVWGVPDKFVYANYRDMLQAEKNRLDAVVVLTPTPSHAEIVIDAIQYDYPVICDKALACSSSEIKLIKEAVEKKGGYLAVTYNYTGYPMIRELQAIIHKGYLGNLQQIHIEMPQDGFLRLDKNNNKIIPQEWRLKDNEEVPTLSLDLCVHIHNMIHFFTSEKPHEVISVNNNYGLFKGIVDNTMCIARYTGNLDCQIWFGKTALGHSNGLRIRIYGSKGSAEWYQMHPETILLYDNKGRKNILDRSSVDLEIANKSRYNRFKAGHPDGFIEAFSNYYSDIADSLIEFKKNGRHASPWVFGVDNSLEGLFLLEAIIQSAKEKKWKRVKKN